MAKPKNRENLHLNEQGFTAVYQQGNPAYKARAYLFLAYLQLQRNDRPAASYSLQCARDYGFVNDGFAQKYPECKKLLDDRRFHEFVK